MFQLIFPLALLFLSLSRGSTPVVVRRTPPQPQPKRPPPARAPTTTTVRQVPKVKLRRPTPQPSSKPKTATEAAEQAAVNAAVTQAVRDELSKNAAAAGQSVPESVIESPAPAQRTPLKAAQDLRAFLLKTKRFGSARDKPAEVIAAQRDMGVVPKSEDDWGYVGPLTRARAKQLGVTLPPKP